jgi:hypothetical protein
MKGAWEQCVFGKLVVEPGGRVADENYNHIARSPGMPEAVLEQCLPSRFSIGTGGSYDWSRYPWAKRGGVTVRPLRAGGTDYVVAARTRSFPEEGEQRGGRWFVQVHFLCIRAADWEFALTPDLSRILKAYPVVPGGTLLETLRAAPGALRGPLPAGWLEEIRPYLAAVLSGEPISVQDDSLDEGKFLGLVSLCQAAVPPALAWRVPFGANHVDMTGDCAWAAGLNPATRVSLVNGKFAAGQADLTAGKGYLEWLERVAGDRGTISEVASALAEELPELARFDGLDPSSTWQQAAASICGDAKELEGLARLGEYVSGGTKVPPKPAFRIRRREALETLLRKIDDRTLALVPEFLAEEWRQAWKDVGDKGSRQVQDLACALGFLDRDPVELGSVLEWDLPKAVSARIREVLTNRLAVQKDWDSWRFIADPQDSDPSWLAEWRKESLVSLARLAFRWLASHKEGAEALDFPGSRYSRLWEGDDPDPATVEKFVKDLGTDDISALLRFNFKHSRSLCVARIMDAVTKLGYPLKDASFKPAEMAGQGEFPKFVRGLGEALAESRDPLGGTAVGYLLYGWELLKPTAPKGLGVKVADAIGDPYATVLIGVSPRQPEGNLQTVGQEVLQSRLSGSAPGPWVERLLKAVCDLRGGTPGRTAMKILVDHLRRAVDSAGSEQAPPLLKAVRQIAAGEEWTLTERLSRAEIETVQDLVSSRNEGGLDVQAQMSRMLSRIRSPSLLRSFLPLFRSLGNVHLDTAQMWGVLSDALRSDESWEFWRGLASEKKADGRTRWRLFFKNVHDLSGRACLQLYCRNDVPIPPSRLNEISLSDLAKAGPDLRQARELLRLATAEKARGFLRCLAVYALFELRKKRWDSGSILDASFEPEGFLSRVKHAMGKGPEIRNWNEIAIEALRSVPPENRKDLVEICWAVDSLQDLAG